jgi:hypothetical protein
LDISAANTFPERNINVCISVYLHQEWFSSAGVVNKPDRHAAPSGKLSGRSCVHLRLVKGLSQMDFSGLLASTDRTFCSLFSIVVLTWRPLDNHKSLPGFDCRRLRGIDKILVRRFGSTTQNLSEQHIRNCKISGTRLKDQNPMH